MSNIVLPCVFALDPTALVKVKERLAAGDKVYDAPFSQLEDETELALREGPFSVTDKPVLPPSRDRHDYMSLARYYWPNPDTPDGLPYLSRDGEVNPEIYTIPDHRAFDTLMDHVLTLGLAFYLTDVERYAEHAANLLRVWFLDPATRMNPNLNFGQGIRGINAGRSTGIIETRELAKLVDGIGLLAGSKAWSAADQQAMEAWFSAYLDWLTNSELGKGESHSPNNHGTFYDAQVVSLALFLGERDRAKQVVQESIERRIPVQFEPDGRQPLELARTLPWHYSVFNLTAWFRLAAFGERLGLDVWNYATADGRGIRRGLDFLMPFGIRTGWPYPEIGQRQYGEFYDLLCQAAVRYHDIECERASYLVPVPNAERRRIHLLLGSATSNLAKVPKPSQG